MGLDPIAFILNSVKRETALAATGMHAPDGTTLDQWRTRTAALNARTVATPVLIQSCDAEAMHSVESFKALRRHDVPDDWFVYLGEGHLRFQPLNKLQVYRRNLDWMRFWLKGEEDADPAKADQYSRWRTMRDAFEQRQKDQPR